jgi:polyisoprenoid-binding protein YceI
VPSIVGSREQFKIIGDLTIRGQTREVPLDVTFNGVAYGVSGIGCV